MWASLFMQRKRVRPDPAAKPLKGFGGHTVKEIVVDGNTWRTNSNSYSERRVRAACAPKPARGRTQHFAKGPAKGTLRFVTR